jgi:hypothetical protein
MSDSITKSENETKKSFKVVINGSYGGFSLSAKAIKIIKKAKDDPNFRYVYMPRHDPDLVKVVEDLGKEANGECAKLKIVTVKGLYNIHEYDGLEETREPDPEYDGWIDPQL